MSQFLIKKLPRHWRFVPSKRRLKNLLAELDADVRRVEFSGTMNGRTKEWLSLGFVESRVVADAWRFYLQIWGTHEATVGPMQEELETAALAEIAQYIRRCTNQPPSEIFKPAQLSLSFRVEPEGLVSDCRVLPFDKLPFFSTPTCWHAD